VITSWHELEPWRADWGHLGAAWYDLVGSSCDRVGAKRIAIEPGRWSTPLHVEQAEEIFFVLGGDGVSLQWDGSDTAAFAVRTGDCLVHRANAEAHTLRAGADGLDVIAFGERPLGGSAYLPRAGVAWLGDTWVRAGDPDSRPWKREVEAGEPDVPDVSDRPARIVNVADVEPVVWSRTTVRSTWRDLARAAGSVRTGLRRVAVEEGAYMAPPHAHAAEDEVFVVLDGSGTVELWPSRRYGGEREEHPIAPGVTIARPAGTHRAHGIRAGAGGLTVLAYGTRDPNDISYYPRSGKVSLRGVGVIARVEQLDYWDGED
jgi:uncharacterized cupin superfamily protein